jgi:hypothetical protein
MSFPSVADTPTLPEMAGTIGSREAMADEGRALFGSAAATARSAAATA